MDPALVLSVIARMENQIQQAVAEINRLAQENKTLKDMLPKDEEVTEEGDAG